MKLAYCALLFLAEAQYSLREHLLRLTDVVHPSTGLPSNRKSDIRGGNYDIEQNMISIRRTNKIEQISSGW